MKSSRKMDLGKLSNPIIIPKNSSIVAVAVKADLPIFRMSHRLV